MSTHEKCLPATLLDVHATYYEAGIWGTGMLVIHAKGEVRNSCMSLEIHESPLLIWPPLFMLQQCEPRVSDPICAQVQTKREVCYYFPTNEQLKVISLTHADGVTEVPVVNGGDCGCPIPMQKKVQLIANNDNEKVGFSSNSIQEAADHALSQFRSQVGSLPLVTEVVNQYLILEFDNSRSYLVTLKRIM